MRERHTITRTIGGTSIKFRELDPISGFLAFGEAVRVFGPVLTRALVTGGIDGGAAGVLALIEALDSESGRTRLASELLGAAERLDPDRLLALLVRLVAGSVEINGIQCPASPSAARTWIGENVGSWVDLIGVLSAALEVNLASFTGAGALGSER